MWFQQLVNWMIVGEAAARCNNDDFFDEMSVDKMNGKLVTETWISNELGWMKSQNWYSPYPV